MSPWQFANGNTFIPVLYFDRSWYDEHYLSLLILSLSPVFYQTSFTRDGKEWLSHWHGGLYLRNKLGTSVLTEVWPVRLPELWNAQDFFIKPKLYWNTVGNWSGRMINDLNQSKMRRYISSTHTRVQADQLGRSSCTTFCGNPGDPTGAILHKLKCFLDSDNHIIQARVRRHVELLQGRANTRGWGKLDWEEDECILTGCNQVGRMWRSHHERSRRPKRDVDQVLNHQWENLSNGKVEATSISRNLNAI